MQPYLTNILRKVPGIISIVRRTIFYLDQNFFTELNVYSNLHRIYQNFTNCQHVTIISCLAHFRNCSSGIAHVLILRQNLNLNFSRTALARKIYMISTFYIRQMHSCTTITSINNMLVKKYFGSRESSPAPRYFGVFVVSTSFYALVF